MTMVGFPVELMVFIKPQCVFAFSATFKFWGIDWGEIQIRGGKGRGWRGKKRKSDWDWGKIREWAPREGRERERGVHFTASSLPHSQRGTCASTDCPRADYNQLCSELNMPGLMALKGHVSSKVSWNICGQHYREVGNHFFLINWINLRCNIIPSQRPPVLELEDIIQFLL